MFWLSQVSQISRRFLAGSLVVIGVLTLTLTTESAASSQVTIESTNDWGAAFQGKGTIRNTGTNTIDGWTLSFDANFTIFQLWNARIVSHVGTNYVLEGIGYSNVIPANGEAQFGFIASPGNSAMPVAYTVNGDDASGGVSPEPTSAPTPIPTSAPTLTPTSAPTLTPTSEPTLTPTSEPTLTPTSEPTPITEPAPTTDVNPAACNGGTSYGPRELKLLTRLEYQNSIQDLVGIDFNVANSVPYDSLIEGYYNNSFTPVTETHADAYLSVAQKVAAWSAERNFQGVVDCGFDANGNASLSYQACQELFLNDFGTRVFRRPLTAAELSAYQTLLDESVTGGDIKVGLELGMTALLNSPRFLYRSEVGTSVQASASGAAAAAGKVTVSGADFQIKSTGGADGSGWNIWNNGYIQNDFTLSNDVLLQISMKGDPAQGVWPEMELVIDGDVVATTTVDSSSYKTYEFGFIDYEGTHEVQIRFTNDHYALNGEDRNLYVQSASVTDNQTMPSVEVVADLSAVDSDAYVLSDYEMASFLSYTLTGSTPDVELIEAARNGELATEDQLRQQAARLLSTARGKENMGVFASQWLGSNEVANAQKDSTVFPDFTSEIGKAMAAEVKAFFSHVFYDQSQGFSDLFSADYVLVNRPLANFYGLGNVGTDSSDPKDFVKVDSTSVNRGGLMTMGAFLANEADLTKSSPIKRAANVRQRILCQDIPQPDDTIPDLRVEKMEELLNELNGKAITTREFIAEITKDSPCSFCHDEIINPLGFTFEDFDASGRYITTDHNGLSIDSSGTLYGVDAMDDGKTVDFTGGKDLSNKFAELDAVKACFSANVFRYAMDIGHDEIDAKNDVAGQLTEEEKEDYGCSVDSLRQTLSSSDSMSELFSTLGTLDVVRYRKQRDR
jgi:hypothetical protein